MRKIEGKEEREMATFTSLPADVQRYLAELLTLPDVDNLRRIGRATYKYLTPIYWKKLRTLIPLGKFWRELNLPRRKAGRTMAVYDGPKISFYYWTSHFDGDFYSVFLSDTFSSKTWLSHTRDIDHSLLLELVGTVEEEKYDLYTRYLLYKERYEVKGKNYSRQYILDQLEERYNKCVTDDDRVLFYQYLVLHSLLFRMLKGCHRIYYKELSSIVSPKPMNLQGLTDLHYLEVVTAIRELK